MVCFILKIYFEFKNQDSEVNGWIKKYATVFQLSL